MLTSSFFQRTDVLAIARELIGMQLTTRFNSAETSGIIVETEAYAGITDKASHAWNNRRTQRTEIMYAEGGTAYVYLCYGIHHLFNVVTNVKDVPHAILIRALEPTAGIEHMLERRNKPKLDATLTKGPGALSQAMGITTHLTGSSLLINTQIEISEMSGKELDIGFSPRIGVDYAGDDAQLPYRFFVRGNKYVNGKPSFNK